MKLKNILLGATLLTGSVFAQNLTVTAKSNQNGQVVVMAKGFPQNCDAVLFKVRFANGREAQHTVVRMPEESETFATFLYEPSSTRLVEAKAETLTRNGGVNAYAEDIK
jgi:hypothetical protein